MQIVDRPFTHFFEYRKFAATVQNYLLLLSFEIKNENLYSQKTSLKIKNFRKLKNDVF